jgi:hypothetical protein
MPIHKLQKMGDESVGVVLPKDELREMEFVDDEGVRDGYARIDRDGDSSFSIELIEE